MKSNIIVKALAILLGCVFVVVLLVNIFNKNDEKTNRKGAIMPLSKEAQASLGIEADTPDDTVRTMAAQLKQVKLQLEESQRENEELSKTAEKLLNMENSIASSLQASLNQNTMAMKQENAVSIEKARSEIKRLLGNDQGPGSKPPEPVSYPDSRIDSEGYLWISPPGGSNKALDLLKKTQKNGIENFTPLVNRKIEPVPVYTIAKNSTLVGSTAFTALIGRVPVGQNVVDPYGFKVIVGHENLIANGHRVPELDHAVMSGKAMGDWTLGCVSGAINSITFVFKDGRIRTIPEPADVSKGGQTTRDLKIGELSDDLGNPCIVGEKITNAGKYLFQRSLATAAQAAAQAAASSETSASVTGSGTVTAVTGSKNDYVLNQTLAGTAQETAQWLRDRQSLEFDAVYVKPGARVAVHITEELKIDYEPDGRLTHYDFNLGGKYRALD